MLDMRLRRLTIRAALALAVLATALAPWSTTPAPVRAGGQPVVLHEPYPDPPPVFSGACLFDVGVQVVKNREVQTIRVDARGVPTWIQVRGDGVYTLSNLGTGKSVTYNSSAPIDIFVNADGSVTVDFKGRTFFAAWNQTIIPNQFTLLTGHSVLTANGPLVTSLTTNGQTLDICAVLAP